MADPGFNKERYWAERNATKLFREGWYEWRKECKELYGAGFVNANKGMFTQAAFANYLEAMAQLEADEAARQLAAPPPPEPVNDVKVAEASAEGNNVIVTNIDGSPAVDSADL